MCDIGGSHCFEESMARLDVECDCPHDCSSVWYTYALTSTPLNGDILCDRPNLEPTDAYMAKYLRRAPFVLTEGGRKATRQARDQACREYVSDMVVVEVQYSAETCTKIRRSVRVTFADRISSLGNKFNAQKCTNPLILFPFRWNHRPLHWDEHPQPRRGRLLDCQDF